MTRYNMEVDGNKLKIKVSDALTLLYAPSTQTAFAQVPYWTLFGRKEDERIRQPICYDITKVSGEKFNGGDLMNILNKKDLDQYQVSTADIEKPYISISKLVK